MSFLIERYFQILENHAIYGKINSAETLSFFAERHVIAVWSYNALLRSLQKDLVASSLPINSEPQKIAIRLITEMVLNEEVDDLGDGSFELGNGGADIRELDDVGLRLERQGTEFGKGVADFLILRKEVREGGDDAAGQGDVAELHGDAGVLGKSLNDRQKGVGGQRRSLVGLGVENCGKIGHVGMEFRRSQPVKQSRKKRSGCLFHGLSIPSSIFCSIKLIGW